MRVEIMNLIVMYAVPFLLAFAAVTDIMYRRIPNKVVLALFLLFFPTAWMVGMSWDQFLTHLAVFAAFLVLGFLLFLPGWFGSGDGKMLAVCGLWLGWPLALQFVIMTIMLGGVFAVLKLTMDRLLFDCGIWFPRLAEGRIGRILFGRERTLPYGVPLAAAILVTLPLSMWTQAILLGGDAQKVLQVMAAG